MRINHIAAVFIGAISLSFAREQSRSLQVTLDPNVGMRPTAAEMRTTVGLRVACGGCDPNETWVIDSFLVYYIPEPWSPNGGRMVALSNAGPRFQPALAGLIDSTNVGARFWFDDIRVHNSSGETDSFFLELKVIE